MVSSVMATGMSNIKDDSFVKEEVIKYQETGVLSDDLAKVFMAVATKYANLPSERSTPTDLKEDMVAHAVMQMTKSCKTVKTDRGMMLAFLGQSALCSFAYVKNKEFQQRNVIRDKTEYDSCGGDDE